MNWHLGLRRLNLVAFCFMGFLALGGLALSREPVWLVPVVIVFALFWPARWIIDGLFRK